MNAGEAESWGSVLLYVGAVAFLLLFSPWRSRRWFLSSSLGGLAFGCYLPIGLELIEPEGVPVYATTLATIGLLAAAAAFFHMRGTLRAAWQRIFRGAG